MTDLLREYYTEHRIVFQEKFSNTIHSFDVDAIHKMRTSTKRLRALFQLIEFLTTEKFNSKKQLRKIRKLFKYSGTIREIQIEKTILGEYESKLDIDYPEYEEYLKQREHREISRFLKSIPNFEDRSNILNDKYILERIESIADRKHKAGSQLFLNDKIATLKKLISQPISNERIHKNRTVLKQLYYLYEVLATIVDINKILTLTKERLREIEQTIGKWHDLLNSSKYLNAFFKTKKGEKTEKYITLLKLVKADRDIVKKEIIRILKKEIKFGETN